LYGQKFDFSGEMSNLEQSLEWAQKTLNVSVSMRNSNDLDTAQFKWHMALEPPLRILR
jgi:hypothetical protein